MQKTFCDINKIIEIATGNYENARKNMNKHTTEQITRFMSILKSCGRTKDEIFSITALMKTEDMMLEIAE